MKNFDALATEIAGHLQAVLTKPGVTPEDAKVQAARAIEQHLSNIYLAGETRAQEILKQRIQFALTRTGTDINGF